MTAGATPGVTRICGFREYCDVVRDTFFAADFRLRSGGEHSFVSRFVTRRIGSLEVTEAMATSHVLGYRGDEHIRSRDDDRFVLNITLSGHVRHSQFGRTIDTPAGHLALIDTRTPYRSEQMTTTRALYMRVPGAALRGELGVPEDFCAVPMDARRGLNATLLEFLLAMWREKDSLTTREQGILSSEAIELLGRACARRTRLGGQGAYTASELPYDRAIRHIDEHLSDPTLGVGTVARAVGVSNGHLQALARERGLTIGRTILAKRLDRCRQALGNRHLARRPILSIALDWGFCDAAHFSRAFKGAYRVSPRVYRQQQLLVNRATEALPGGERGRGQSADPSGPLAGAMPTHAGP